MKHALSLSAILLATQLFVSVSYAQTVSLSDADKLLDFAEQQLFLVSIKDWS